MHNLNTGDLAIVISGNGPNNVRQGPNIRSARKGQIPQHALLAILPRPAGWTGAYPHSDGVRVWWYVRGRTEKMPAPDRFEVIEGWTAAGAKGNPFLGPWKPAVTCVDAAGMTPVTHLLAGQEAYVLPPDGLNIREQADPHAARVGGLAPGTIVTLVGGPTCNSNTVWWQVQRSGAAGPAGWVSEGDSAEWFLAPLTLE